VAFGSAASVGLSYTNDVGQIVDDFGSQSQFIMAPTPTPLVAAVEKYHIYNPSASSNNWSVRLNGTNQPLQEPHTGSTSFTNNPTLGIANAASFDGNIAEVLIFDVVLSAGERTTLKTYLNTKYSLGL
jgi:hypothetical protein